MIAPTPNIGAARAFLSRLDPEAEFFTAQTFDDDSARRAKRGGRDFAAKVIPRMDPANGSLEKLVEQNQAGVGVFVTVNRTDGNGRATDNIVGVRAVFVDLDGAPIAPVLECGLEPHIVVETSPNRFHAYWLVDDCALDQFEPIQQALARRFGGDPSVHDLPRVARLPGFLHSKRAPFLSRVLDDIGFNGPPYSLAEIVGTLQLDLTGAQPRRTSPPSDGDPIGEGSRNAHLFALGRSMAKKGLAPESVLAALLTENETRCDPPLPNERVHYIAERAFTAKDSTEYVRNGPLPQLGRAGDAGSGAPGAQNGPHSRGGGPDAAKHAPGAQKGVAIDPDRFRVQSVPELCAMPAPRWLIRDVLQEHSLALVWGASGSGKTFLALDAALSLARGVPWFGRRVRAGGVIYVAGEGRLRSRIEAYLAGHELRPADVDRFRAVVSNVNLLDPNADVAELIASLQRAAADMGGVALVVLDTLNAMMPGGDENASDDMGTMIGAARQIMAALGCSAAYVHHAGKEEARGARGHSSLRAAVDTEILVKDEGGYRLASIEKQRDGETGARFAFKLRPVDLGASGDPDADPDEHESSCVVEPIEGTADEPKRAKRDIALESLHEAIAEFGQAMPATSAVPGGARAVTLDQWQRRWRLRTGDDYGDDKIAAAAFRRERKKLVDAGRVQCCGQWVWIA